MNLQNTEKDKIELQVKLGEGRYSEVFKAKHEHWGIVALKQMKSNW